MAIDSVGNCYIVGRFNLMATFGSINVTATGPYETFLAKYNSSGTIQWVRQACRESLSAGDLNIAADASGNVLLTGGFQGTATFGSSNVISAGQSDFLLAKYNSSGALQWITRAGGTLDDHAPAIG